MLGCALISPRLPRGACARLVTIGRLACSTPRKQRHRGDSNPCGQSPMGSRPISLNARTQCHVMQFYAMCKFTSAIFSMTTCQPDRAAPRTHLAENPARQSARRDRHGAETCNIVISLGVRHAGGHESHQLNRHGTRHPTLWPHTFRVQVGL